VSAPLSRMRRVAIAASALFVAACLFRTQVAQALVVRGDDYLYQANNGDALSRYARALAFDPRSDTAADRFVFISMEQHTAGSLERGIHAANDFLRREPNSALLLRDRALCYLIERRYRRAVRDFARAAALQHDAPDAVFAGWAALHAGDRRAARAFWREALAVDPADRAARAGLMRIAECC